MSDKDRVNILLVDDQPGKLLSYEVMLAELDENLVPVTSARDALAFLLKSDVAVILVDVCMPELDGFELAKMIREHPRFQKTAIIFISAIHLSESDYLRGYEAGAVDYIPVPVVPELLRAKVRVFAELFRKTRELQQLNNELERRVEERTEALALSADQLRQSEQRRSLALVAGGMGAWDHDLKNGTWFWDEGQSRILGIDRATFVPSVDAIRQMVHPEDREDVRKALEGLLPDRPDSCIEFRILRADGETRWCSVSALAAFDENGQLIRISGVSTDITDRKDAEARQLLLAREVDHRAKNTLAVVQAVVRMAKRDNVDEYAKAVEGRIAALAQTHELLSQSRWEGASILQLVLEELAPYRGESSQRVTAVGPPLTLKPEQAQIVAMAIHELATNAAKYGSLSVEAGRVDIAWSTDDQFLKLSWRESGGPRVEPPRKTGFGTKIISSLGANNRGKVSFDWAPSGLKCDLQLRYAETPEPAPAPEPVTSGEASRLLLVEDEVMVGAFMQELLEAVGYRTTKPIARLADALNAARNERFDAAVLDMNLNGEIVYPLAELLIAQNVPFVFVTGYAPQALDKRFNAVPILQKPVAEDELVKTLNAILPKQARGLAAAAQ
ncbi:MAG TPA: response regulator [Rhizomicrobium sp.]|nr:response regulator [Rhizomicrobium sp.]